MNLKLENAQYYNLAGTVTGGFDDPMSFNIDITDLDGKLFKGTIPYTYVDYNEYDFFYGIRDINISEIQKYIKSKLNDIKIKIFEVSPDYVTNLYAYKAYYRNNIDRRFNMFINEDSILFDDDLFNYKLDTQNILSNFINNYNNLISLNKIKVEDIRQEFVSASTTVHKFNYSQMVDLLNIMVSKYSGVKLYFVSLKNKLSESKSVDEIKSIKDDLNI